MTTPLMRKAYQINQEINDNVTSYPLKYEKQTNKWKFNCRGWNSKTFRIHLLMYMFQGVSTVLLGFVLTYVLAYQRDILKTIQVLVGSLLVLIIFNGFVIDLIVIFYGNDIASCINAVFELAKIWPEQMRGSKF